MKLLLLLMFLSFPLPNLAEENRRFYLSCDDYNYLMDGLDSSQMDKNIKEEIAIELFNATLPSCFDS